MRRWLCLFLCGLLVAHGAVGQESGGSVRAVEVAASSTLAEAGQGDRHAAYNAFDGDPASYWVEGKSDNGIGESVRLVLDREISVDAILLMPGLYLPEYHGANNRIKKVKVEAGGSSFTLSCEDAMKPQRFNLSKPIRSPPR